jgi:hypothetical protein
MGDRLTCGQLGHPRRPHDKPPETNRRAVELHLTGGEADALDAASDPHRTIIPPVSWVWNSAPAPCLPAIERSR